MDDLIRKFLEWLKNLFDPVEPDPPAPEPPTPEPPIPEPPPEPKPHISFCYWSDDPPPHFNKYRASAKDGFRPKVSFCRMTRVEPGDFCSSDELESGSSQYWRPGLIASVNQALTLGRKLSLSINQRNHPWEAAEKAIKALARDQRRWDALHHIDLYGEGDYTKEYLEKLIKRVENLIWTEGQLRPLLSVTLGQGQERKPLVNAQGLDMVGLEAYWRVEDLNDPIGAALGYLDRALAILPPTLKVYPIIQGYSRNGSIPAQYIDLSTDVAMKVFDWADDHRDRVECVGIFALHRDRGEFHPDVPNCLAEFELVRPGTLQRYADRIG